MKKILTFALAVIMLAAALASCGGNETSGGDTGTDFAKEARSSLKSNFNPAKQI